LIVVALLTVAVVAVVLIIMWLISRNSPSITGYGHDEKMKKENVIEK
jgi:uncharacterized membrane-anchored protein